MEKLVKLNRMRLEVLKKCLYWSHHLAPGGNTLLRSRLRALAGSYWIVKTQTRPLSPIWWLLSSLFTCKHCWWLMTFSWSHCCFLSLPFMVSEIIHREDECCTSRANKILIKRYLWTEEGHAVKCHISWNLKKALIPTQQSELWFNNCSAQSMCNTTLHFLHL